MIRLKLNHAKTVLPRSISNGTLAERMQKARVMNLIFYDSLQDSIKNNEITPFAFIRTLKKTLGAKVNLDVIDADKGQKDSKLFYSMNEKGMVNGFDLKFPFMSCENKIHKNSASVFLSGTQMILNEMFNPKIVKRFINLYSNGNNIDQICKFYDENLKKEAVINEESLDKLLKEKNVSSKIDTLQFLRYKLQSEQNTMKSRFLIDNHIQRHNKFKYERPARFYDLDKYHYEDKLACLNSKLLSIIESERN